MLRFIARRAIIMVFTVIAISIVSFFLIELPPGDYLSNYIAQMGILEGEDISEAEIEYIKRRWGLDQPVHVRYLRWAGRVVRGDFGRSMIMGGMRIAEIIAMRIPGSLLVSISSLILVYVIAIPVGTFVATHQYTLGDYVASVIGFVGLATPNFLLALILLWINFEMTGNAAIGLFSREFAGAPWSFAKFLDLLKHMWIPALVVGTAGTAGLIRTMRANLLDELEKPYVRVARSKGISPRRLLYKYPFRIALNPVISVIGWTLPALVSGELLVSIVLNLPTLGPVMLSALLAQDMYLASSIILILSTLTVIGTLVSDILLAWIDPRIREAV
jgi:peptide/nickel transport system permease protein